MRRAALAAASLILSVGASAAPLDAFISAFGEAGVQTLSARGYVVIQGSGAARRLAAVHWKALEGLAAAAPSCWKLSPDFAACRSLPSDGAMTPGLHALADAVAAANEERFALAGSSASATEPNGLPNLFDTPWGKDFATRRGADRVEDFSSLAKPFFTDFLSGTRPNPEAARHFLTVEPGATALLASDAARGAVSDGLRPLIARYLRDESRRRGLERADARVAALSAEKETARDLDDLTSLEAFLAVKPGLLASLETAVSNAPAPSGAPKLRSAGIHLREPVRLGQYELGDEAVVSGAYWVDGLPEGGAAEIDETTVVETSAGFSGIETRTVRRGNGGPYPYERRLTIGETNPFAVVAIMSAASGTVVAERAEVAVAPDFELSLKKEAEALQDEQSCDPMSAAAAYAALADLVADAAKVKPQYRALLERAARGRVQATKDALALAKLEEDAAGAREDSSPKRCSFGLARADSAIARARALPAGCDRVLPELFAQRAAISRRAADQAWFLEASAGARSLRRSCDFSGAARRWTEALAVLDADPDARCGRVDAEAKAAEDALSSVRRASEWTATLAKALDKADAETAPAERLALTAPALARLSALADRECRRDAIRRAERTSAAAGDAEAGPSDADAARRLPTETDLAVTTENVRLARARLAEKTDAAENAAPAAAPARAQDGR